MDEFYRCTELKKIGTTHFYGKFSFPYPQGTGAVSASLLRNMLLSHFPNFGVKSIFVPEFEYQNFRGVHSTIQETIREIKQLKITSLFCPKPNWKQKNQLYSKLQDTSFSDALFLSDPDAQKLTSRQFQSLTLVPPLARLIRFHTLPIKNLKGSSQDSLKNIYSEALILNGNQGQLQIEKRLTYPPTKRLPRNFVQPTVLLNSFFFRKQIQIVQKDFHRVYIDAKGYSKFEQFSKPHYIIWNNKTNSSNHSRSLHCYFLTFIDFTPEYSIQRKNIRKLYTDSLMQSVPDNPLVSLHKLFHLVSNPFSSYYSSYSSNRAKPNFHSRFRLPKLVKTKPIRFKNRLTSFPNQNRSLFQVSRDKKLENNIDTNTLRRQFLSPGFGYCASRYQTGFSEKEIYFPYPLQSVYPVNSNSERVAQPTTFPIWIQFGFENSLLGPHPLDTLFQPSAGEAVPHPNVYKNFFVGTHHPSKIGSRNGNMQLKKTLALVRNRKSQFQMNDISPVYEIDCTPVNANVQKVNFSIYENILPLEIVSLEMYTTQIISPFLALQIARGKILQNVHRLAGF